MRCPRAQAELSYANLTKVSLKAANMRETISAGTNFNSALLQDAMFDGSSLDKADFTNARDGCLAFFDATSGSPAHLPPGVSALGEPCV